MRSSQWLVPAALAALTLGVPAAALQACAGAAREPQPIGAGTCGAAVAPLCARAAI